MKKLLLCALLFCTTAAFAQPVNENKSAKIELLSSTVLKITNKDVCANSYTILIQGEVIITPLLKQGESGTYTVPTTDCKQMVTVSPRAQCASVWWTLEVKCAVGLPVTFTRFKVTLKN